MRTILRRLLLLGALMFWQGGFMFYGAVVVPVGSEVLGSHRDQGFITRSVTNYLNGAGAVCLAVWFRDMTAERGLDKRRFPLILLTLMVVTLGLLVWLHLQLDQLLDPDAFRILDRARFRLIHQWYLIISTAQWACSILLAGWTLQNWRAADQQKLNSPNSAGEMASGRG